MHREGGIGARATLAPLILLPDRAALFERCDARVAEMFAEGAVEEVSALIGGPMPRAIGVAEIADYLAGNCDRDAAVDATRHATRQYAKRQYTWFRNQPPPAWQRVNYASIADFGRLLL